MVTVEVEPLASMTNLSDLKAGFFQCLVTVGQPATFFVFCFVLVCAKAAWMVSKESNAQTIAYLFI